MTIAQDANKQGEAEGLEGAAQDKASEISLTSEKDALGDSSLDDVSGGVWPFNNLAAASYASTGGGG
ncbi:hypothetical protein [Bradyrhizobium sp. 2S1]|uniref:hypothetical protein n=1 Tax=Bradyrhizobium sp. 2S1 TaxID=1404429 RepID=UPI00140A406A|nr:hypothetical protein [Bradyrhizobium sp. 2S1]MCK7670717.1 hypothetical protein [Bradyrhizobium sp. 2S1]